MISFPGESREEQDEPLIPTRPEVLEQIVKFAKQGGLKFERELFDDRGIYLLEMTGNGEAPGETVEYRYQRKGTFGGNSSSATTVSIVFYEDGIPVGGKTLAEYDETTGVWIEKG